RTHDDVHAIIEGLIDGTIDCIASDHAPHAQHEKETDIESAAFGIIGLETSVALGLTYLVNVKHIGIVEFVRKHSTNPRRLLGLQQIKIENGAKANFTILDLNKEWAFAQTDIHSKSSNTPFVGMKLKGQVVGTINNGQVW